MNNKVLKKLLNHNLVNSITSSTFGTWSRLGIIFNSKTDRKHESLQENTGLFGVPELRSHEGFNILREKCVVETNKLIEEATSKHRSRKMVQVFDDLSDSLCRIADLAEFIRIAHPSSHYARAAETACMDVSSVVEKLNTNAQLYSALVNVVRNGDKLPTTEIDDHVAQLFLFDFEQSGIHLPSTQRSQVVALNDRILQLGQVFVAGSTGPRVVDISVIPKNLRDIFTVDGNNVIVGGLCADSSNSTLREITYRIYFYGDDRQDFILNQLLSDRHQLAQICGFSTYAHRALKGSTLEEPATVMEFLNCLSDGLRERADQDFQVMSKMKQSECFSNESLAMWDTPYFTKKAKKQMFSVQSSEFSPYFSLGTCMEGLNNLTKQLYGIELIVTDVAPGECWADDVYKLAVTHEKEGLLGYIYCDFYERIGKPNQDCHFTIRGGRALAGGSYQHPIVVLMLNLPLPRWSTPTLLSPGMVDNLFHEMGHALHSMLARTRYQHVTGTRCSTDFAEVPSVLMEYFASDIRVLKTFAKHFQTKEPMSEDMLQRLCASKHLFTASEMQMQVFYSVLDQIYHSNHPLEGSTTDVLAKTQEKYYSLPYVQNTTWQLRFSHLVGYGAKYYSYLVSRAVASYIWQSYFEKDPLNRIQGELYRHNCLAYGGGKPPRQLLTDYLQKQPSTKLLVESILKDIDKKQNQQKNISFKSQTIQD